MKKYPNLRLLTSVLFLLSLAIASVAQEPGGLANLPAPASKWDYFTLKDFSGGLNTNTFSANLLPNQARELFNLVIINGQPTFRPGYTSYATITANRGVKGIFGYNRSLDDKRLTFAANSGFMWADTGTGSFYQVPGSGTLDSTKYVQAVIWKDTLLYVDGVQDPKKTDGRGTYDGTVVDTGVVVTMSPLGRSLRDIDSSVVITEDAYVDSTRPDSNLAYKEFLFVGTQYPLSTIKTTTRYYFKFDVSQYQPVDSVRGFKAYFWVKAGAAPETLVVVRCSTSWNACCSGTGGITWNSQPILKGNHAETLIVPGGTTNPTPLFFQLGPQVDSIANGTIANNGFMIRALNESPVVNTSKGAFLFSLEAIDGNRKPFAIQDIQWASFWNEGHARRITDTLIAKKYPDNDLVGYFVYFVRDSAYRQITGFKSDSGAITFFPPLFNPKFEGNGIERYRIYAAPSSKDKIDTGHVDSIKYVSRPDSLIRVYVGKHDSVGWPLLVKNSKHYLKITSGKGAGFYQVLTFTMTPGTDTIRSVVIFSAFTSVFNSTTKWELFEAKFPPCADVFVGGDRVFYMQADKPYVWFSEVKNTAQVEPDNFYVLGGEKLNALFGLAPTALTGFSEPLNLMFAASNSSIWGINVNSPDVAIPQRVSAGVGISFKNSIVYLPEGGMDWLNPKGQAYRFNGRDVQKLSLTIPDRFDPVTTMLAGHIAGFHLEGIDYWWEANQNYTTGLGYALSVANNAWSTHDVPFRTAFRQFVPSDSIPVLIGAVNTGKILRFGRSVNDSGIVIGAYYTSPWFDLGHPAITKEFRNVTMTYRGSSLVPPSMIMFVANSPLQSPSLDSITFTAGGSITYQDHVEKIGFKPGIIGKLVSFRIRVNGVFKLGTLEFRFRLLGRQI